MKKILILLLCLIVICSLAACDKKTNDNTTESTNSENALIDNNQTENDSDAEKDPTDEDWGVEDRIAVRYNQDSQFIYFRWPYTTGRTAGSGMANGQGDGTFVLVDRYGFGVSPENVELENFFPAYSDQTIAAMKSLYKSKYTDGSMTVESSEVSVINDYTVCEFTGKHIYTFEGQQREYAYVAYVTTLKSNGGYVYWLVEDKSKDQSLGDLIQEHADRIIGSVWEPKK